MTEIIKYHNDINKIPLRKFKEKEIDLLFSFIFKMRDMDDDVLKIDIKELCELSGIKSRSNQRIYNQLETTYNKILNLDMKIETDESLLKFNLFRYYEINKNDKTIKIQIESKFKYLLNELIGNYTKFELEQLVSFKSSYSKNIFRLLKQYESTKFFIITLDEFKRLLCIPETYKPYDIDRRILNPVLKELSPIFSNLQLEKIKQGKKIDKIQFKWEALKNEGEIENKEVKISKKLSDYIEVLKKKNRYINPYLTPINIEILLKDWNNERLIKGLKFARNQIQKDFTSLNYLKKVIETGIEASEKVFAIVDEKNEEKVELKNEEKTQTSKPKAEVDSIIEIKGEIAKWCLKHKKYSLFEELEKIDTLITLGKFIGKYDIEI